MTGAHVANDLIGVPGTLDDLLLVIVEPLEQKICERLVLIGQIHLLQALHGFAGDQGVGELFQTGSPFFAPGSKTLAENTGDDQD